MGTVVFLLEGFAEVPRNKYMVAVLSTLLAIGIGCWWVGRTSIAAERREKIKSWAWGIGIITVGAVVSFMLFGPSTFELDWQKFTKARLGELRAENRIVFVDFTGPG